MANEPAQDEKEKQQEEQAQNEGPLPIVDDLGVTDLTDTVFANYGRIFSAAGRDTPVAEIGEDGVLLHPADKPFDGGPAKEVIIYKNDDRGVMLNELGQPRKIVGAKYKGRAIYTLVEQKPGTVKHYAGWFDDDDKPHKLYVQAQALTSDMIFRIRNRTPDGEIGIFSEITTD